MTHSCVRHAFALVAALTVLPVVAGAQQQRVAPRPRPRAAERADTGGVVPPRDVIIPPTPARPAGQVGRFLAPTPAGAVLSAGSTSPLPVFAAAVRDTSVLAPTPLARLAPPPVTAVIAAAAPTRALNVNSAAPVGATALCKDGSYLTGGPAPTGCTDRGGVAVTFPAARSGPALRP